MVNKNDLFYICSLIESISRESGNSKADIVDILGEKKIKWLYKFAEVNHCLPIEQVTDEIISLNQINRKQKTKQKRKQSIWDSGHLYQRLILSKKEKYILPMKLMLYLQRSMVYDRTL